MQFQRFIADGAPIGLPTRPYRPGSTKRPGPVTHLGGLGIGKVSTRQNPKFSVGLVGLRDGLSAIRGARVRRASHCLKLRRSQRFL